jgi:hypothetical protein
VPGHGFRERQGRWSGMSGRTGHLLSVGIGVCGRWDSAGVARFGVRRMESVYGRGLRVDGGAEWVDAG